MEGTGRGGGLLQGPRGQVWGHWVQGEAPLERLRRTRKGPGPLSRREWLGHREPHADGLRAPDSRRSALPPAMGVLPAGSTRPPYTAAPGGAAQPSRTGGPRRAGDGWRQGASPTRGSRELRRVGGTAGEHRPVLTPLSTGQGDPAFQGGKGQQGRDAPHTWRTTQSPTAGPGGPYNSGVGWGPEHGLQPGAEEPVGGVL